MIAPFNIFVIGGSGFMIPYESRTYNFMVLPQTTWADTGDKDVIIMIITIMMMMMMMMMARPGW